MARRRPVPAGQEKAAGSFGPTATAVLLRGPVQCISVTQAMCRGLFGSPVYPTGAAPGPAPGPGHLGRPGPGPGELSGTGPDHAVADEDGDRDDGFDASLAELKAFRPHPVSQPAAQQAEIGRRADGLPPAE